MTTEERRKIRKEVLAENPGLCDETQIRELAVRKIRDKRNRRLVLICAVAAVGGLVVWFFLSDKSNSRWLVYSPVLAVLAFYAGVFVNAAKTASLKSEFVEEAEQRLLTMEKLREMVPELAPLWPHDIQICRDRLLDMKKVNEIDETKTAKLLAKDIFGIYGALFTDADVGSAAEQEKRMALLLENSSNSRRDQNETIMVSKSIFLDVFPGEECFLVCRKGEIMAAFSTSRYRLDGELVKRLEDGPVYLRGGISETERMEQKFDEQRLQGIYGYKD